MYVYVCLHNADLCVRFWVCGVAIGLLKFALFQNRVDFVDLLIKNRYVDVHAFLNSRLIMAGCRTGGVKLMRNLNIWTLLCSLHLSLSSVGPGGLCLRIFYCCLAFICVCQFDG